MRGGAEHFVRPLCSDWMRLRLAMNMLKISKAIFRSLLSSRSLCVAVVALMVLCALPVFRSAAGIDGRVEYLESGITRVEQELSASYADALVNAGEEGVYTSSSSMPALLYPLAAGRLVLAPLSPLLPFLQVSDGAYSFYDGSKEYLLWAATAVAVSFLAARLNKREKLIIQAPMGELGRLVASSVWASVFAMLAVFAVNLPGIIAALVKNGPGSLFYPIGYVQYATPVIKPAWLVFAQTAILQFLVAAFISLVVHLAVKIANNPTLGIVFVCALMGATMVPGYYGRSIALREFALLNPLTYANTELTVGAYSPYPTTQIVNLPGLASSVARLPSYAQSGSRCWQLACFALLERAAARARCPRFVLREVPSPHRERQPVRALVPPPLHT